VFYEWWKEGKTVGDGLDYPDPFELDIDVGIGLMAGVEYDECVVCQEVKPLVSENITLGPTKYRTNVLHTCADCIDAYERESPEELAITLGDGLDSLTEAGLFAADASWMLQL